MLKYVRTVIAISVHPEGENPIFGESATHVKLCDEAGGFFIELGQCHDATEAGTVRFDPVELQVVLDAAKELMSQAQPS